MIRRYPYELVPKVPGALIPLGARLHRHLARNGAKALARWSAECLNGVPVALRLLSLRRSLDLGRVQSLTPAASFLLAAREERELGILVDPGTARTLASAILRLPATAPGMPTAGELGVVAFGIAWLIEGAVPAEPWAVRSVEHMVVGERWVGADAVECEIKVGQRVGRLSLLARHGVWASLAQHEPSAKTAQDRLGWIAGARYAMVAELAMLHLPVSQLERLQRGDIIASPTIAKEAEGAALWLSAGPRGGFEGVFRDGKVEIATGYRRGRAPMSDERTDTAPLEELDVELVVELGRIELAATDLMRLRPGDVVTLERPLVSPLDLRVGGRVIGRGELVDVDGEAGIRLTQIFD